MSSSGELIKHGRLSTACSTVRMFSKKQANCSFQTGSERSAPHGHTEPHAVAKSLDKFIRYNQAVGHDAWQGLLKDYNIFTPLGFHHMVDQISLTGDQCAALPEGHKHSCDGFDREPESV